MPSRKQRRRRQKERRHDYEFVYVDEEGHEVEVDENVLKEPPRRDKSDKRDANGRGKRGAQPRGRGRRSARVPQPPSWSRSGKRGIIFFPLFLLVFSLVSRGSSYESRFVTALLYTLLFIPLTYLIDRTAYRTYMKRSGRAPAERRRG
jgi:hypothetical protein